MTLYDAIVKIINSKTYTVKYVYLHDNILASEEHFKAFEQAVNAAGICTCERLNSGRHTTIEFGIVFKAADFLVWQNIVACNISVNEAYHAQFKTNMHMFDILNQNIEILPETKAYLLADEDELHIN